MKKKSGQALVEYILLVAVIAGTLAIFQKYIVDPDKSVVGLILGGVQCQVDVENGTCANTPRYPQAQRGGRPALGDYYANKKASVTVK